MTTVKLAGNGFGGVIQGAYGTYNIALDGSFTVDTRDAPPLLQQGMAYVTVSTEQYTTPLPPPAAAVGAIVASVGLSNGTLTIASSPSIPRPVAVVVGTGTTAITAGNVTVTYVGNDGQTDVDVFSLACAASSTTTQLLSRGVDTITSAVVTGLTGGTSPFIHLDTTAALSLPVAPGAIDFAVQREYDGGATVAVGTVLSTPIGSITTTTAPNGTLNYSFVYVFTAPAS
jgi:hypothetical protein